MSAARLDSRSPRSATKRPAVGHWNGLFFVNAYAPPISLAVCGRPGRRCESLRSRWADRRQPVKRSKKRKRSTTFTESRVIRSEPVNARRLCASIPRSACLRPHLSEFTDRINKRLEDVKQSVRADELPGTRTTYSTTRKFPVNDLRLLHAGSSHAVGKLFWAVAPISFVDRA